MLATLAFPAVADPQPHRPVDSSRKPEQAARADIDALLSAAGWIVQDYRFIMASSLCIVRWELLVKMGRSGTFAEGGKFGITNNHDELATAP